MKADLEKSFWSNLSEQLKTLIGAALGLVAGLAWNDAISGSIKLIFPSDNASSLVLKFIYAITITILIVAIVFYMNRVEYTMKQRLRRQRERQKNNK
jgi:hypothetical protein